MSKLINWYTFAATSIFLLCFDYWLSYYIAIKWVTGLIFTVTIITLIIVLFLVGDTMTIKKKTKTKKKKTDVKNKDVIDLNKDSQKIQQGNYKIQNNIEEDIILDNDINSFSEEVVEDETLIKEKELELNIKKAKEELQKAHKKYLEFKGVL